MSQKYTGGFITKSPVAPTTSAASGIWTLDQQQQAQKAGTWPSPPIFIEDIFSTYLWTTSASNQTLTTGIDMTQGALTWIKSRSNVFSHVLQTGVGGGVLPNNALSSNTTGAYFGGNYRIADSTTGFTMGTDYYTGTPQTAVVWTFRKQPKFFDVVTLNSSTTTYNHNLGSTPGCIIVKCTDASGANWVVWHRSFANTTNNYLSLNTADAVDNFTNAWPSAPTSTQFSVNPSLWANGSTGIAYLFAHDAGGFPVSGGGSTNGISCGSFTTDGSGNATVSLGYEPQFLLQKPTSTTGNWFIADNMRGMPVGANATLLRPNLSNAESAGGVMSPTATGFSVSGFQVSQTYIYIAIRRGPMKVPTDASKVFWTGLGNGSATVPAFVTGFTVDGGFNRLGLTGATSNIATARLTGNQYLVTNATDAAVADLDFVYSSNTGYIEGAYGGGAGYTQATAWAFRRAPSFFDVVCYTGTGSATTFTHNLGVVPELMIVKGRSVNANWAIYTATTGATQSLFFTDSAAGTYSVVWNDTAPTSSVFTVGTAGTTNSSGGTYVAYLFATCAGVSKVGSYTGTGALQTVNCGFTSGARFVLIKRTDSTGDWYTYDSARGITAGNDPYLFLNSTAAEVTGTNYVDTDTTGFQVTAAAPAGLNANGGTYIFLAIA